MDVVVTSGPAHECTTIRKCIFLPEGLNKLLTKSIAKNKCTVFQAVAFRSEETQINVPGVRLLLREACQPQSTLPPVTTNCSDNSVRQYTMGRNVSTTAVPSRQQRTPSASKGHMINPTTRPHTSIHLVCPPRTITLLLFQCRVVLRGIACVWLDCLSSLTTKRPWYRLVAHGMILERYARNMEHCLGCPVRCDEL